MLKSALRRSVSGATRSFHWLSSASRAWCQENSPRALVPILGHLYSDHRIRHLHKSAFSANLLQRDAPKPLPAFDHSPSSPSFSPSSHFSPSPVVQAENLTAAGAGEEETDRGVERRYKESQDSPPAGNEDIITLIQQVIEDKVAPSIRADGGDITFVSFSQQTGECVVQLHGACVSCASSTTTMRFMVQRALMFYIPEITSVKKIDPECTVPDPSNPKMMKV